MSASLVGSEMCIRDRARRLQLSRSPPWQQSLRAFRAPGGMAPREGSAVSYTHLTLPTICSV
eukprot:14311740-Alexandrium_andersonii.AAC.1